MRLADPVARRNGSPHPGRSAGSAVSPRRRGMRTGSHARGRRAGRTRRRVGIACSRRASGAKLKKGGLHRVRLFCYPCVTPITNVSKHNHPPSSKRFIRCALGGNLLPVQAIRWAVSYSFEGTKTRVSQSIGSLSHIACSRLFFRLDVYSLLAVLEANGRQFQQQRNRHRS